MKIQEYLNKKIEIQEALLKFFDDEDGVDVDYHNFDNYLLNLQIQNNLCEFKSIISMIISIVNEHHRTGNIYLKIKQIFSLIKKDLIQHFTYKEIFDFFKDCKLIILYLLEEKIITEEQFIEILPLSYKNNYNFCFYFYPELKNVINSKYKKRIESKIEQIQQNFSLDFDLIRRKGENEGYICELIRNDCIEEFITYVNKTDVNLSGKVSISFFETNELLLKRVSFIEYCAFYGSIQIFQYLIFNKKIELTSSLWLFSIHGRNAEIINFLEENKIKPPNGSYEEILKESIKCFHNEIAEYIINNLIEKINMNYIFDCCFQYHNYCVYLEKIDINLLLLYATKYNYIELVKFLLNNEKNQLNLEVKKTIQI